MNFDDFINQLIEYLATCLYIRSNSSGVVGNIYIYIYIGSDRPI